MKSRLTARARCTNNVAAADAAPLRTSSERSWNDLHALHDSGRWDLEAHTHAGHVQVPTSAAAGDVGAFLLTREWLPLEERVETIDEWTTGVSTDRTSRSAA